MFLKDYNAAIEKASVKFRENKIQGIFRKILHSNCFSTVFKLFTSLADKQNFYKCGQCKRNKELQPYSKKGSWSICG